MQDEGPCVPFALLQIRSGGVPEVGCSYKEAQAAGAAPRARHASAMLNAQERAHIEQVWDLIAGHEAPFGAELLLRLFTVYPSTTLYFKHLGTCPDEVHLLSHGQRMLEAVGVAVQHMDNLRAALSPLADLHAHVLRVDPTNFPLLIQCFQVVLASHLQDEFTVEMQAAWDKFLTGVAIVLTEKYR